MSYSKDELALILLDSIIGLEYVQKKQILSFVGSPRALFDGDGLYKALENSVKPERVATIAATFSGGYQEHVLSSLEKRQTVVITRYSPLYPEEYEHIQLPPLCVYANGNVDLLKAENKFAVVGSRKCPAEICRLTTDFCKTLAKSGAVVVTGSAGGADSAAIEGALDSGNLICVLAGGIDRVYPEYNKRLIEKVASRGLVISEHSPVTDSKPWMFPVRNRLIAGLAKGVLIAGGKFTSGARHTAAYALDGGKEVFAFPYPPRAPQGELNNSLIKQGACLCDSVEDILDFLQLEKVEETTAPLEGEAKTVYAYIKAGDGEVDALMQKTSLKIYELTPLLSELEIQGFIVKAGGNKYKCVK